MLMLSELPGMVTVFEQFFYLECSDSYTCNIHGDPRIEGYHYCICQHSQGTAVETLLALTYNSFILTVAIIGVGIYSIEAGGYNVFDSHARDMYHNSHSEETCALLEIQSMHKLVYFQTLHRIYMNLKVNILPPLKLIFSQAMLNIVVYQMLIVTNVPVKRATL